MDVATMNNHHDKPKVKCPPMTRRNFLRATSILALAHSAPSFLLRTAGAGDVQRALAALPDERILVVVQLAGGNDGLNMLVPFGDDAYYRARPTIGIPAPDALKLSDGVGLHPRMTSMADLWGKGQLGIVQGVGYPNPNRSHFRSTEIWETAVDSDKVSKTGWIGRYLDARCSGAPHLEPTLAIAIKNQRPQSFEGTKGLGVAVDSPERFGYLDGRDDDDNETTFEGLNKVDGNTYESSGNASLDFLRQTTMNATLSADKVRRAASLYRGGIEYPGSALAQDLRDVARLIAGGMPTRLYYVSHGGFDTHAGQRGPHERLLGELSDALAAFQRDLEYQGQAQRVLTMTFSEFGRRVSENASGGTDHGTAAPMFLMGACATAGLHGAAPSLTKLDRGDDLIHTTDFRGVYASVLRDWFGADPSPVLGPAGAPISGLIRV